MVEAGCHWPKTPPYHAPSLVVRPQHAVPFDPPCGQTMFRPSDNFGDGNDLRGH
ncbi:MAG: hypothetical protein ABF713_04460 [Acetobacter orientalis]